MKRIKNIIIKSMFPELLGLREYSLELGGKVRSLNEDLKELVKNPNSTASLLIKFRVTSEIEYENIMDFGSIRSVNQESGIYEFLVKQQYNER